MDIKITRGSRTDLYNLTVNGKLEITDETFAVVCSVQQSLKGYPLGPKIYDEHTEADEVAARIKAR